MAYSFIYQGSHSDWKKWEGIFQSGNFEQTGKVGENLIKYWKISDKYYLMFSSDI